MEEVNSTHTHTLSLSLSLSLSHHLTLSPFVQAIDGFLIVLDKDANILYVSETIAGHVGLIQVSSRSMTIFIDVCVKSELKIMVRHPTFSIHIAHMSEDSSLCEDIMSRHSLEQ